MVGWERSLGRSSVVTGRPAVPVDEGKGGGAVDAEELRLDCRAVRQSRRFLPREPSVQNSLAVVGCGKLGAMSPRLRRRPIGHWEKGILVVDEILEEPLQSACPPIVRHQPNADTRREFGDVVDKSFGRNLIGQIKVEHAEAITNRAPLISRLPVGIQKEPHGSAVADTDGWLDAVEDGVPVMRASYLGHIWSEFACRARVLLDRTVDVVSEQEVLDDMHIISALDVQSGAFDGRHQRTSMSCSTATLI